MASLTAIQNKIDKASIKYNLTDRTIYMRVATIANANPMLVESTHVDNTDTILIPQPFYSRPEKMEIGALRAPTDVISADGTAALSNAEYVLFFTPNMMTRQQLSNPLMTFVFKDSQANEEEFRVTDFESIAYQGGAIAFEVYIKSFKKQIGTI